MSENPAPGPIAPTAKPKPETPGNPPRSQPADTKAAQQANQEARAATTGRLPRPSHKSPSPLQKQHRDLRSQPDYAPASIYVLTGRYTGQMLDLGLQPTEMSHSEAYEWESQDSNQIRPGLNFKKIGNREISLSVTFFDLNLDISHLVENFKHLGEISDDQQTPPRLLFMQGDLKAVECVCTSVSDKYSEPLPDRKGYRKCEVSITLLLNGGANSPNSLGGALTSTPMNDRASRQTEAERQRMAVARRVELLMADCLGSNGSQDLESLIEKNQQNDVEAIAALDPNTFVQSAIAGIFTTETLANPKLKTKLRASLAVVMAQNSDGVANSPDARPFAEALAAGDGAPLRPKLKDQFELVSPDFEKILGAIADQALDESSELFDRNINPTAGKRLFALGGCGLDLRRNGASSLSPAQKEQAFQLKEINEFFAGKPSDQDIRDRFKLPENADIGHIKNGQPYQSKDEFVAHNSGRQTLGGAVLWANFGGQE